MQGRKWGVGAAALLGNPKDIELAIYYFGIEHVLFGTDVPLGINPAGATEEIIKAIQSLKLGQANEENIFRSNVINFINGRRYTYVDDN